MLNQMIISDLRQFGLNEYESRAYLVLTIYGSSIAAFISEHTKIPSSKVYEVLNTLKSKGLVEVSTSKPKRFKAIDPKCALSNIVEQKQILAETLKQKTEHIVSRLIMSEEKETSQIWSSAGKEMYCNKIAELYKKSRQDIVIVTTDFSRNPCVDDAFLKAVRRKVKVLMICTSELKEDSRVRAEWYAKNGADIKAIPLNTSASFLVSDSKELIFNIVPEQYDFMWSSNIALAYIMKSHFERLWEKSDIIQLC
jgi:sugar-specific transcriptional regulator TrmB